MRHDWNIVNYQNYNKVDYNMININHVSSTIGNNFICVRKKYHYLKYYRPVNVNDLL